MIFEIMYMSTLDQTLVLQQNVNKWCLRENNEIFDSSSALFFILFPFFFVVFVFVLYTDQVVYSSLPAWLFCACSSPQLKPPGRSSGSGV